MPDASGRSSLSPARRRGRPNHPACRTSAEESGPRMKIPIGIDLGTTMSVVAQVTEEGIVRVLENDNGDLLTPSVVHFESAATVIVGQEAKDVGPFAPDRVIAGIKRRMGTDFSLDFDGVPYRPEGISAIILRALVASAAPAHQ